MRQRGFTLLEMMLILLLMGVSAGMVMLAFPASHDDDAEQTLARFQAQLRFVQQRGLQTGQFFGVSVHPDRWQFLVLEARDGADQPPAPDGQAQPGAGDPQDEPQSARAEPLDGEQRDALEQWLRQIPDDPGELLRRKFLYEQQQRQERSR